VPERSPCLLWAKQHRTRCQIEPGDQYRLRIVDDGFAHATNDIGLVPLPDGRRIAIAVFVTDSTAGEPNMQVGEALNVHA
jgi:hypothetical protein